MSKLGLIPGKDVQLIPTGVSESDRRMLMMIQARLKPPWARGQLPQLGGLRHGPPVRSPILHDAGAQNHRQLYRHERQLIKQRPRQLKGVIMAMTEGTAIGGEKQDPTMRIYRKYMKIEDQKCLELMEKTHLLGRFAAGRFRTKKLIQKRYRRL